MKMFTPRGFTATHLGLTGLALIYLVACGGPRSLNLAPASARSVVKDAPEWLFEVPQTEDHLTATATATSRDMQVAMDKARIAAQAGLAQQLGARLDDVTRRFMEETGAAANSELLSAFRATTKTITSERITGTHVVEREVVAEGDIYRAYVMLRTPIGAANQLLLQQMKDDEAMYTRFRASAAYDELEEEIRRFQETQQ
ncbi:MAG: hypothetical protein HOM68_01900 [Gemmatimonadetes bacterium]|jgi:hypothetical protein|nr:hypothetical protein [Gemmatimonadota bacterium]MBT5055267.1 hypothetical protein [Gemmatimonadota bacterium]MBT5142863.1 hypothetical protein [Gemmatimonadota bacterium]MBT5589456.1 hypothetical protein [Gemmatimonadota bacterium]MBT5960003.1 hypothetical protein [Gemmatimonadota bacterium]